MDNWHEVYQTYCKRVELGLALLENFEPGVTDKVDLDTLDMSCSERCVLAQALGDGLYETGLRVLDLTDDSKKVIEHGFVLGPGVPRELGVTVSMAYAPLTVAWSQALLHHRRTHGATGSRGWRVGR